MKLLSAVFIFLFGIGVLASGQRNVSPIDMEEMLDASTLDVEVVQDWHVVKGKVPTRQKYMTINVGELWPGQNYRVPVRFIVPADRKAKGFHLTGGHQLAGIEKDSEIKGVGVELLIGGVGLVYTIIQNPNLWGQAELGVEMEKRFIETLKPRYTVKLWGWPASLCRAVTAAYSETDYFEQGKIAMSGGSKNGASPSMALIHDERMTAIHASRSPIWDSPLRMCDEQAWETLNISDQEFAHREGLNEALANKITRHAFRGGFFGPDFNLDALAKGHSWKDLQGFTHRMADHVFISRNLEDLRTRNVDLYFHPGTNDFVCFDVPWGGKHHSDIPVYLETNLGHGKNRPHPALERNQKNLSAFLLNHFFDGVKPLLESPETYFSIEGTTLTVTVRFDPGSQSESGRIWWMYDRGPEGSGAYLGELFSDDQWKDMAFDSKTNTWAIEIELDGKASYIDFFSNHRKTIDYGSVKYPTYISSPYTRISLR
ncbi:MAG: hypothetical protein O7C75_11380 [Verrucomicrobia bacterium]|nr:hypothetical protein [Verrucomicrobiota bacterium]